jgi:CheY-like chemotaxis protein
VINNGIEKPYYDVILMDVQMPEMDGYETTRTIRSKFPEPLNDVKIIAMTAGALPNENRKCFEAGMNEFISKPFETTLLVRKIYNLVNSRDKKNQE